MSHFYGTIKGTKGEATRCGHKSSGMRAQAASWDGCVQIELTYDEKLEQDIAHVYLRPWNGRGVSLRLYEGPVNPQPLGDVDAALRCATCVNFSKWKSMANGPVDHCDPSAPGNRDKGETDGRTTSV